MVIERASTAPVAIRTEGFGAGPVVFSGDVQVSPLVPAFIPADQVYFWSIPWQNAEKKALEDLAAGRARTFADPAAAVHYLLGAGE